MRPVSLGRPAFDNDKAFKDWVKQAFAEIERATYDDIAAVAADFTVTNYTKLRTLDGTTGTAADVRNVVCTFLADLKARGMKRSQ